ncbi:MAG: excinuclease ABC subunit UvrC [Rickettsiales bacterium]|nr:excinuclease ABC subunit UvrC [Rickettsiales bacterium]
MEKILNAPTGPGIYKMLDADGVLLYVGKAKNLRARLKQYSDISKLEPHKQIMRSLVAAVQWETVPTESDALVLEQKLIKTEKPRYNIMLTDGKMYPYLVLSRHEFPRMEKYRGKLSAKKDVFGPFPSVGALDATIRYLQKSCRLRTCADSFMRNRMRPCMLYQIGRCSGPCVVPNPDYANRVELARKILSGNAELVIRELKQKMTDAAQRNDFENAAALRDQIAAITETAVAGKRRPRVKNIDWDGAWNDLENWLGRKFDRAFVFDNSHLFGKNPVGAAVCFDRTGFVKSEYRHFHLKDKKLAGNDIGMMGEFISRTNVGQSDLLIADGGPAQWNIAKKFGTAIGVVKGVVRNGDEHFILPNGKTDDSMPRDSRLFLMLRAVRDEAHRFAIGFHRKTRDKKMLGGALAEIEGIGPARKRELLQYFGGIRGLANADAAAIARVPGVSKTIAEKVYGHFHP